MFFFKLFSSLQTLITYKKSKGDVTLCVLENSCPKAEFPL